MASALGLQLCPLNDPLSLQVANGDVIKVTQFVRVHAHIGSLRVRMFFRVVDTPLQVVLGYPFLARYDPSIDWTNRSLTITFNGQHHLIRGFPTSQTFANCIGSLNASTPTSLFRATLLPVKPMQLYPLEWAATEPVPSNPGSSLTSPVGLSSTLTVYPELLSTVQEILPLVGTAVVGLKTLDHSLPTLSLHGMLDSSVEVDLSLAEREEIELSAEPQVRTLSGGHRPAKPVEKTSKVIDHTVCGPPVTKRPLPAQLIPVIERFKHMFPEKLPLGLPPSRATDHRITLVDNYQIPTHRVYRMSPVETEELRKQVDAYLAAGHIEPACSPFGAGVLFVPKKEGTLRMCVDYRALNKITLADRYPMPRIDEMLDSIAFATYFTKLDLTQGFHQIRIHPESIYKTAFQTKFGSFQFRVMPFGLSNAPATFQRTMNNLFDDIRAYVGAYMDDIIVFSKTLEEHVLHVTEVLSRLERETLYGKESKTEYAQPEVEFCGYIVGSGGIRPQPSKLQAVYDWKPPCTPTQVRSFLGLCGFYNRFVPHFATIAAPLTDLLHKSKTWEWSTLQQESFDQLKRALLSKVILAFPDTTPPYVLHSDASEVGIGATLSQPDTDGHLRLIACRSRKLHASEKNYPVHEKELLALVDAFIGWQHYLHGVTTHVYTDNTSLSRAYQTLHPDKLGGLNGCNCLL